MLLFPIFWRGKTWVASPSSYFDTDDWSLPSNSLYLFVIFERDFKILNAHDPVIHGKVRIWPSTISFCSLVFCHPPLDTSIDLTLLPCLLTTLFSFHCSHIEQDRLWQALHHRQKSSNIRQSIPLLSLLDLEVSRYQAQSASSSCLLQSYRSKIQLTLYLKSWLQCSLPWSGIRSRCDVASRA